MFDIYRFRDFVAVVDFAWNDGMEVGNMAVGSRIEALDDVCSDIQQQQQKQKQRKH